MAALRIDIVTLFPKMFSGPLDESILGRARDKGIIDLRIHDLRQYSEDRHQQVDDKQFGGGAGMVLKVEPIYRVLKKLRSLENRIKPRVKPWVIYLSPQGKPFSQKAAAQLVEKKHLILLCGHYEGIDERAMRWIDEEVSIGDYVLTGGELPAMVLVDAACRLVPGVVKERESIENDSFFNVILDHSHYTRPAKFMKMEVPAVLLSGHHEKIVQWRKESAMNNTRRKRPDLLNFTKNEKEVV